MMNTEGNIVHFEETITEINTLLDRRRLFREFQEVLEFNTNLDSDNPFIRMVISGYISDQCMRVRRLLDCSDDSKSLTRFLMSLNPLPKEDIKALQETGLKIKKYATNWIAHNLAGREKYQAGFKHLDQIIDKLHQICLNYIFMHPDYQKITPPTLDLPFQENWRSIFYDPWISDWRLFIKTSSKKHNG